MSSEPNRIVGLVAGLALLLAGVDAHAGGSPARVQPDQSPWYVTAMETEPLSSVEIRLQDALDETPDDQQLWLALGTTRVLLAGEQVGQFLYRKGFRVGFPWMVFMPMVGLPVAQNPEPEPVTMGELDAAIESWIAAFARADEALAHVDDPDTKLRIRLGLVHMDFNTDAELSPSESLWRIFARVRRNRRVLAEDAKAFVIAFDGADAAWMRGYAHLIMASGELALSLDYSELFARTGRQIFPKAVTPFDFLGNEGRGQTPEFLDIIAMAHLTRFPIRDEGAVRRTRALEHVLATIRLSRQTFDMASRETDNDREWLPSPTQQSVLRTMQLSGDRAETWLELLDELEAMLRGRKLAPFWRGPWPGERGVNIRRAVLESDHFDLILWIQGTDASAFLEDGEITDRNLWRAASRLFDFHLGRYAFWIN